MQKEYAGFAYRQAKDASAPWLVAFVATAEDLLTWVGIPRRSDKGLIGFQRLDEEPRVIRAKKFFDMPTNQSPTALIIGIHKPSTEANRSVRLEFIDDASKNIRKCRIIVDFDAASLSPDKCIELIREQTESRLKASSEIDEQEEAGDTQDGPEDDDIADSVADDDAAEEIELGKSLLRDVLSNLEDKSWVSSNIDDIRDFAKPATLIDGSSLFHVGSLSSSFPATR